MATLTGEKLASDTYMYMYIKRGREGEREREGRREGGRGREGGKERERDLGVSGVL